MKPTATSLISGILIGLGIGLIFFGWHNYIWLPQTVNNYPAFWNSVPLYELEHLMDIFREQGLILILVGAVSLASGLIGQAYQIGKSHVKEGT